MIDLILLILGSTFLQNGHFEFIPHDIITNRTINQIDICYSAPDWTNNLLDWNYRNMITDDELDTAYQYLWLNFIIHSVDPETDGCPTQTIKDVIPNQA